MKKIDFSEMNASYTETLSRFSITMATKKSTKKALEAQLKGIETKIDEVKAERARALAMIDKGTSLETRDEVLNRTSILEHENKLRLGREAMSKAQERANEAINEAFNLIPASCYEAYKESKDFRPAMAEFLGHMGLEGKGVFEASDYIQFHIGFAPATENTFFKKGTAIRPLSEKKFCEMFLLTFINYIVQVKHCFTLGVDNRLEPVIF